MRPLYVLSRCESMGDFAERVGMKRRNAQVYMHGVGITTAEKAAERLGYLPSEVWGDDYGRAVRETAVWDGVRLAYRQERSRGLRSRFLAGERRRTRRQETCRWVQWVNQQYRKEGW